MDIVTGPIWQDLAVLLAGSQPGACALEEGMLLYQRQLDPDHFGHDAR